MCGIFGIITADSKAPETTFKGLLDIEYRGYDSWGVAYFQNGKFSVEKKIGFLPKDKTFSGAEIAIGHTRWATHGGVTELNAHPHKSCDGKIVMVHNGIVENYLELKKKIKKHEIKSETDTEIVVHLIEDEYRKLHQGSSIKSHDILRKAVANVFKQTEGLNAFVVSDGKSIVAVKRGSPIVAGDSKDGAIIASDPNAILPHTKKLLFLEDDQLIEISKKEIKLYTASLSPLKLEFQTVPWEYNNEKLDKYDHFLEKEIHEQPRVLLSIAKNTDEMEKVAGEIKKAYGTYLIACGSASYSCLLGVYLLSAISKRHVNFSIGSEFNYIQDFIKEKSLVIAVSQSGETIDVVEPVGSAKKKGAKIISLVNVLGSSLYRMADYPVLLNAGPEKAVCSTKALTAMFAHMVLLSYCLIGKKEIGEKILLDSAKEIESIIKRKNEIKKLAKKIIKQEHMFILGRGLSYPVALEATLKIKENTYIHAEGFAGGELKHGVIALISKGTPVIVFVPNDETREAMLANAMEVKARGAFVIGIGALDNPVFDYFFKVSDVGASSVIPHPVVAQLLSYYLALELGNNPDKPRNLAKSVVVK